MTAQTHAALWRHQCIPACLHLRATGVLFWYNNTPVPQLGSHAWDYDLDQTASFFAQKSALAPLHAQFEYLSNRVSVVNDTCAERRLAVRAEVYDFESRRVWERSAEVLSRGESCVDAFAIPFDELLSREASLKKPHFVKLRLMEGDREVDSTFYWRSNSAYEGQETATGPCTGGFAALSDLPKANVRLVRDGNRMTLENCGDRIAFTVEVRCIGKDGRRVVPVNYSDNFVSLLPGERTTLTVEGHPDDCSFVLKGWNIED